MLLLVIPCRVPAQWTFLDLPVESQQAQVMQRVGTTDISVTYSRPAVKGRTIWGTTVPYDRIWRAGANENTVITRHVSARDRSSALQRQNA